MYHHLCQITWACHQEHYNPRYTSDVHMYHEREHKFSLFPPVQAEGVKDSGAPVRVKYLQKNVGLLSYVQLIKLWCAPSPCSCMRFHLFPQPCSALPSRSITLKHVFVLSRLDDCIFVNFFSSKGQCSSQHVASCLSGRGSGRQRNSINIIALMVFTWV